MASAGAGITTGPILVATAPVRERITLPRFAGQAPDTRLLVFNGIAGWLLLVF